MGLLDLYGDGAQPGRDTPRWTAPQQAVIDSDRKLLVWWGANGIGKSRLLAWLAILGLERRLHWQRPRRAPPVVMVLGESWKQLGVLMEYFFELAPSGMFRPGVRFESGAVKGQRMPVFDVVGGRLPGAKLILGIFDPKKAAGPRAEVVITDEPLPERVHNELWGRLVGRGGRMYTGFTPTMGTAHNIDYLWRLVDDPAVPWAGEIQTVLTMDAVTVRGGLVPWSWMRPEEIAQLEQGVSPLVADMRMGRSRTPARDTAYFGAWGPHLRQDWTPPVGTRIGIGIDHGSKPGAQRASLVYIGLDGTAMRIHVAAHYRSEGRTEIEDDARGIVDMIHAAGHQVSDVDVWIGDRAHSGNRWGGVKSNQRLQRAIGDVIGLDTSKSRNVWQRQLPEPLRRLKVPRKYDGSVWDGVEVLHRFQVAGRFTISTSAVCNPLDEDFAEWQGKKLDPHKDGIDSVRYIAVPMIDGRTR